MKAAGKTKSEMRNKSLHFQIILENLALSTQLQIFLFFKTDIFLLCLHLYLTYMWIFW